MLGINKKLQQLDEKGEKIKVALVGSGLMGKGMVSQMMLMKGIRPSLVIDRHPERAIEAYTLAGVNREDIVI